MHQCSHLRCLFYHWHSIEMSTLMRWVEYDCILLKISHNTRHLHSTILSSQLTKYLQSAYLSDNEIDWVDSLYEWCWYTCIDFIHSLLNAIHYFILWLTIPTYDSIHSIVHLIIQQTNIPKYYKLVLRIFTCDVKTL